MQYTKHGENKPLNKLIGRRRHYDKTRLSLNRVVVCGDQQTEQKDEELKEREEKSQRRRLPCLPTHAILITSRRQREVKHWAISPLVPYSSSLRGTCIVFHLGISFVLITTVIVQNCHMFFIVQAPFCSRLPLRMC